MVFLFIGCGSSNSSSQPEETDKTKPHSPVVKQKEKIPPSIPII
jgi:hypothetical protein